MFQFPTDTAPVSLETIPTIHSNVWFSSWIIHLQDCLVTSKETVHKKFALLGRKQSCDLSVYDSKHNCAKTNSEMFCLIDIYIQTNTGIIYKVLHLLSNCSHLFVV